RAHCRSLAVHLMLQSWFVSVLYLFFSVPVPHRGLRSFPTRRSSDLAERDEASARHVAAQEPVDAGADGRRRRAVLPERASVNRRSEEHTSELQSHLNLVCRLLLEKKK